MAPEWQGLISCLVIRHLIVFSLFGHGPEIRAMPDSQLFTRISPPQGEAVEWMPPMVHHEEGLDRAWFADPIEMKRPPESATG